MGYTTIMSPNRVEAPRLPPQATTQGSLFNLTMNEIHNNNNNNNNPFNHLGKPSSMIMDDYLKNIPTKDDKFTHKLGINKNNASCCSSSSSSSPQSSASVNLNRTISNKPFDEVWKDILQQSHCSLAGDNRSMQLQHTAGETTLEEFLVQTGAINVVNQEIIVNPPPPLDPIAPLSQQPDWLQLQMTAVQQQQQQMGAMGCLPVPGSLFGNPVTDVGYSDDQLGLSMPMPMDGVTSSDSQAVAERKRGFSDEMLEKTIERRQKRMIKNRESAARSRAKKQAYNNKLQYEGSQLQIMNNRLKKEKDIFLHLDPDPRPKYQLRRTSSALR